MAANGVRARISSSPDLRAWVALAAVYLIWGSTYTGIQVAVRYLPPLLMTGVRFLFAGALLYAVAGHRGGWRSLSWGRPTRAEAISAGVVGLFLLLGGNGLLTVAELKAQSGIAALMIATVPLWMALFGGFFTRSQGPGLVGWLGVMVGLGGVAVLVDPGSAGHLSGLLTLELLGSAILWSIGSLYSRRAPLARNVLLVAAVEMGVGGTALLILGLATGEASQVRWVQIGAPALIAFVWLVFVGAIVGFTSYTYALKHLPATTVATYAYVNPVVALLLGWIVLGQGLTPAVGLAAVLITLGVVLMVSGPVIARRRAERRVGPVPEVHLG
jgi:drug/metabolite transporter (DMT)-like permease